jgi:hypothetical protein
VSELLVQCPRCLRSGFTEQGIRHHWCKSNGGQVLPVEEIQRVVADARNYSASMDKPWGYDVEILFHDGTKKTFNKQGTRAKVDRWAIMKGCHKSHTITGVYTRRQWTNAFGQGKM